MSSSSKPPFLLTSLLKERFPRCRKGAIFANPHILPLKDCLKTMEHCSVCDQKIKLEGNNGQGMNFVFVFVIFLFNLAWYWPIVGLSFKDDSIYYYLAVSSIMIIVLQPWLMRLSRVLFLYLVVPYQSKNKR
jgi:uncharacterized protein (DUF983 family)